MAELEIERKFLLLPCSADVLLRSLDIPYRKDILEQFYVSTKASPYTRYRKNGKIYYQTIKSGEGLVREEKEYEVSKKEYNSYKIKSLGRIITKNRYIFEYENHLYEMDIFKGSLKGLCYLEIEFEDEKTANAYKLPKIFKKLLVAEVTFDRSFNNSSLSKTETFPIAKLKQTYLVKKKTFYQVTPFLPTEHAINTMIYLLTEKIKKYQRLLQQDPKNVEALHQFRIHMRKLRALLQEFAPFFNPRWLKTHKKNLADLMGQTNAKRDNDVALIDIGTFQKKLSSKGQNSLDTLKDSLAKNEKKLEKDLVEFMSEEALISELKILNKISQSDDVYHVSAKQPLILVAINVINKRIKQIISEGRDLKKDTDKKLYHKLRIQFKKLRYLLELLSPIIEASKLENALEHLRTIQTILGEINDIEVQKSELKTFDKSKKSKKDNAFKSLEKKMEAKEKKKMKAFKKAFKTFKKEKSLYQTLLFV